MAIYVEIDSTTKIVLVSPQEQPRIPDFSSIGRTCIEVPDLTTGIEGQLYNETANTFSDIPKTILEKSNTISDEVTSIIDTEFKKPDYFFGLGFVNGQVSASKYTQNVDAVKLTKWAEACWKLVSEKQAEIAAGTLNIDTVDRNYLITNLPKVTDF